MKKLTVTLVAIACAICCILGLAACNNTVAVESVALNKTTLTLSLGGEETLTATITPDDATDKTVTWASDNTAVATVDNGKVTGVAIGTANITATVGEKTATCAVTVSIAGTYYIYWLSDDKDAWEYSDGEDAVMNDNGTCVLDGTDSIYTVNNGVYDLASPISGENYYHTYAIIDGNVMWLFSRSEDASDISNAEGFAYKGEEISAADKTKIETASGVIFVPPVAEKTFVFSDVTCEAYDSDQIEENKERNEGITIAFGAEDTVTITNGSTVQTGTYTQSGKRVVLTITGMTVNGVPLEIGAGMSFRCTYDGSDLVMETQIEEDAIVYSTYVLQTAE